MFRSLCFQSNVAVTVYLWNYFVVTVAVTVLLENWGILFISFRCIPFWEKNFYILFFFQFIRMLTLWLDDRWLVHMDTQVSDGVAIDGLVIGGVLVFTMLRTYTSSKSGLSARKSESNSGDATISLRMVNEDTSRTCIHYYARSHTRCYRVTISLVSKVGRPFIPSVTVLFAWLTATAPNLCMTK